MRWVLRIAFRIRVTGDVAALERGSRLVIAHCTSALDGVLLGLFLPGQPLVVATPEAKMHRLTRWLMRCVRTLTIDAAHPIALKDVVHHVRAGGVAVIFPQGRVTTHGGVMKIYDSAGVVAARCGNEVVPVALSGTLYSRYAHTSAAWPKYRFPQVTISVHAPVRVDMAAPAGGGAKAVRGARAFALQRVMQNLLAFDAVGRTLFSAFVDALQCHGRRTRIIEDARRQPETYGQLLKVALALGRLLARESKPGETMGVLMPTISTTLSLVLGLTGHGRRAAMLNYSAGAEVMLNACVAAGVRTVITSRQFLAVLRLASIEDKLKGVRILYIEDLRAGLTLGDKLWLMAYALWFPRAALPAGDPRQPAVVLFTSGSEGTPKGVVLSHAAMLANVAQLRAVIDFGPDDKYFSALPLYHIFGLVACALMPLMTGTKLFLYVSPLRYRTIPDLVFASGATYLFGTGTFLAHYARQAHPGDFQTLRKVISGGEKLNPEVAELWYQKFGLRILEGYGATECGPAMALNTPLAYRKGTVGCFLPGIEYRLLPVEYPAGGGILCVRGPNLMSGYLHYDRPGVVVPPRASAGQDEHEGWHETGDIVAVDADGFVTIAGRSRRFAKIAGEMVSLDAVERVAITASPRHMHAAVLEQLPGQGESTVLFTTDSALDRAALLRAARASGASDLTSARRIVHVSELPVLGNGKIDYVALAKRVTQALSTTLSA